MYKIRFHLGRGDNFMKWQVKHPNNFVEYFEPEKRQLAMFNAKLKVQLGTSTKIHEGACKTVCAWIECEEFQALGKPDLVNPNRGDYFIRFNPKYNPNWVDEGHNIINNDELDLVMTQDRSLFVVGGNFDCNE